MHWIYNKRCMYESSRLGTKHAHVTVAHGDRQLFNPLNELCETNQQSITNLGFFQKQAITLILAWKNNHIHYRYMMKPHAWGMFTYPCDY